MSRGSSSADAADPALPPLLEPVEVSRLARAAASPAPILVVGEPGTGRSTLAHWLHQASPRRGSPFVEVDPGALPADLFEAELFGWRAGAFTGAERSTEGRVDLARGGTLVLDRVESLPLAVQPKLLRLLEEGRFAPLGGREREADVRFVAIASEDLPLRVERGAFRADLFYRLEVLSFRLPPLRERPHRLPAVVEAVLADLATRLGRPAAALEPEARQWMQEHAWPGNLRQLRNLLERALILEPEGLLAPPPPSVLEARPRPLAEVEAEEIRRALAFCRGHQGEAAAVLGISRKTLWEKRRRYGIP
ncbi:MAG TPA: sigma 54-interacting transcriptional regulator [Thermoanaerobaculia bacterium]|nr:sigma 54-interacting transcriptional regulator [Thermoanaerobaculia bacterium]